MDKQFLTLNETVNTEIFTAHAFPPILMGQKTEGQLGARNELIEAYEVFHKSYVNNRQAKIDRCLTYVCDFIYPGVKLSTKDADFIGLDYVGLYQSGLVDINEARQAIGLQPVQSQQQFNDIEFRKWNDNDISVFEQFGEPESNFEAVPLYFADLTANELKVMGIVSGNEKASVKEIAAAVKIDEDEALKILKTLQENGKIKWTNNAINITEVGKKAISDAGGVDRVELRYKYTEAPEALPLKGQSRPFCKRMTGLGRVYTREDIDQMSSILGYDVWKRRGGWYTVPDSEPPLHIPHCRHEWRQVVVRRRG